MNEHYNHNYTRENIEAILSKIKGCVSLGQYTISMNRFRQENIDFINEYNIRSEVQKSILMQIQVEGFCHSLQNLNVGYEYEVLYMFVPQVLLFRADGSGEMVNIYTKFNVIDRPQGTQTVVISFHRLNRPVDYLFRENEKE